MSLPFSAAPHLRMHMLTPTRQGPDCDACSLQDFHGCRRSRTRSLRLSLHTASVRYLASIPCQQSPVTSKKHDCMRAAPVHCVSSLYAAYRCGLGDRPRRRGAPETGISQPSTPQQRGAELPSIALRLHARPASHCSGHGLAVAVVRERRTDMTSGTVLQGSLGRVVIVW